MRRSAAWQDPSPVKTERKAVKSENGAGQSSTQESGGASQSQAKAVKVKKEYSLTGQTRDTPEEVGAFFP